MLPLLSFQSRKLSTNRRVTNFNSLIHPLIINKHCSCNETIITYIIKDYLQDLLSPGDRRRSQKRIFGVVDSTILPRSPRQGTNDVSVTKYKMYK